ncbi:MAG: hypothetical protein LBO69_07515 [Ignavibacteria bacterium]|jgi:hypothetical protein|nr:hypothetical protein [Ignavibacteria bacterium]
MNKLNLAYISILALIFTQYIATAQVEDVPISNPVYNFLLRAETKGLLPHYSLSQLPLQRHKIISALNLIAAGDSILSDNERQTLQRFTTEFGITPTDNAVVFYSNTDTLQVLSKRLLQDYDKYIYHYEDANNNVNIKPLASLDGIYGDNGYTSGALAMGTLGFRLSGTLSNKFGYLLQVTNTAKFAGKEELANIDYKYANNMKFNELHKNADITESHITFQHDWFSAKIGRENRLWGAGLNQRLLINDMAQSFDAVTLSANFSNFSYTFTHNSLLNIAESGGNTGFQTVIPNKYVAMHTFTILPSWGEISFFETVIYSRDLDLAYLNPLSFFKTLEHSQKDRDNAGMGLYAVWRPLRNLELKGTWFLDDIKIMEIGTGYWSNKTAWNIAAITTAIPNLDIGIEYTRIEPYTFSHFNPQNANTNDSVLFASYILPNSDRWNLFLQYWYGERYPIKFNVYYTRHGNNIYEDGGLLQNVGGDPMQSIRWMDNEKVTFLDGDLEKRFRAELSAGQQIVRGFSIHQMLGLEWNKDKVNSGYFRLILRFEDF